MKKKLELLMAVTLIATAFFLAKQGTVFVGNSSAKEQNTCIVIDAGHGGSDPGQSRHAMTRWKRTSISRWH